MEPALRPASGLPSTDCVQVQGRPKRTAKQASLPPPHQDDADAEAAEPALQLLFVGQPSSRRNTLRGSQASPADPSLRCLHAFTMPGMQCLGLVSASSRDVQSVHLIHRHSLQLSRNRWQPADVQEDIGIRRGSPNLFTSLH